MMTVELMTEPAAPLETVVKLLAAEVPGDRLAQLALNAGVGVARVIYPHVLGRENADSIYLSAIEKEALPPVFAEVDKMFGVDVKDADDALYAAAKSPHEAVFRLACRRLVARVNDPEDLLRQMAALGKPARFERLMKALEPRLEYGDTILDAAQMACDDRTVQLATALNLRLRARAPLPVA